MASSPAARPARVVGPVGDPLLGHAVPLARGTLRYLERCARTYGDLVPLRFLWKRILLVSGPALIEEVLVAHRHHLIKDIAQRSDSALIGNGLFLSEGATWRRQRRLMQPAFHRARIADYADTMVALTTRALADWRDGETRDVYADMSRLAMRIVARTLFGADLRAEADEVAAGLDAALAALADRVRGSQLFIPLAVPAPAHRRLWRARRRIDAIVARLIAARVAGGAPGDDLLGMLLDARDEDGAPLAPLQVRDEVMTILVGGTRRPPICSPPPGRSWPSTRTSRPGSMRSCARSSTSGHRRSPICRTCGTPGGSSPRRCASSRRPQRSGAR